MDPECEHRRFALRFRSGRGLADGVQQKMGRERFTQIRDATHVHSLLARIVVVDRRHENDRAGRPCRYQPALQLNSRNATQMNIEQQAGRGLDIVWI